jgi:hypothetical protein
MLIWHCIYEERVLRGWNSSALFSTYMSIRNWDMKDWPYGREVAQKFLFLVRPTILLIKPPLLQVGATSPPKISHTFVDSVFLQQLPCAKQKTTQREETEKRLLATPHLLLMFYIVFSVACCRHGSIHIHRLRASTGYAYAISIAEGSRPLAAAYWPGTTQPVCPSIPARPSLWECH